MSKLSILNDDPEIAAILQRKQMSQVSKKLQSAADFAPFLEALLTNFKGQDGKTPEKGKDYFTEEEIAEFKAEISPIKYQDYFTDEEVEFFLGKVYRAVMKDVGDIREEITPRKGVDYRDGEDAPPVDEEAIIAAVVSRMPIPEEFDRESLLKEAETRVLGVQITVEDVVKEIKEKKLLELRDIKGARLDSPSKKYDMSDQRWHGAGGTTSGGANVTTQYLLTGVQDGDNVTIALSQLANFSTFDQLLVLYRNNIPQTEGASYNFTVSGGVVTVFGAAADEIFTITYSYT